MVIPECDRKAVEAMKAEGMQVTGTLVTEQAPMKQKRPLVIAKLNKAFAEAAGCRGPVHQAGPGTSH